MAIGYFQQAGGRMAAALSYYSIFVGGPILVLTLALGSALFGEEATEEAVAQAVQRGLPPSSRSAAEVAEHMVRGSSPTASLALLAGLGSLFAFTRALTSSLNVVLRTEGKEPLRRTFLVGPLLVVAIIGLLWGAWAFELLVDVAQVSSGAGLSPAFKLLVDGLAPLLLATLCLSAILALVPRVELTWDEVFVPAAIGALLWEAARHAFGWLVASESAYAEMFGPFGGIVALLGWVYLSSVILILTGQLAWAYAMERRGRGQIACTAPRQAGLDCWVDAFEGDNAVNEDHRC